MRTPEAEGNCPGQNDRPSASPGPLPESVTCNMFHRLIVHVLRVGWPSVTSVAGLNAFANINICHRRVPLTDGCTGVDKRGISRADNLICGSISWDPPFFFGHSSESTLLN